MAFAHLVLSISIAFVAAVGAICLPDVPLSSNVPQAAIRLLAFRYNLNGERKQVDVARSLLAKTNGGVQAIFVVDANDITRDSEKCLRDIVRDGHLVIDKETECSTRFETTLGFHLPMSIHSNKSNNNLHHNYCAHSVLKLHLDRISLLENEAALDYLRNNDNDTKVDLHNPVSLLSEAQLLCMHKALGCDFVGDGELLYRLCNGVYGDNANARLLDNSNTTGGFVDRNRARVHVAYAHMAAARKSKWRNRAKCAKQVLDLLYVLTDGEIADARKTSVSKYLKFYRNNNKPEAERSASTCSAPRRTPNYPALVVALALCTCGLYGLFPYNSNRNRSAPPKITIRKLVRTLSSVRSTAEDFSKVV